MNREHVTEQQNEFNADHFFLQLILSTPNISEKDLKHKLNLINNGLRDNQRRSLDQLQVYARRTLFPIELEFRRFVDKNFSDDEYVYALISTEPLTDYLNKIFINPNEAVQLRGMIDHIFADSRCTGVGVRSLPKKDFPARDDLIKRLLNSKRFIILNEAHNNIDNNGSLYDCNSIDSLIEHNTNVSISTAFSQEIYDYLREKYYGSTLFDCAGCKTWVLSGLLCKNRECNLRLHRSCYGPYFASHDIEEGICPECHSQI